MPELAGAFEGAQHIRRDGFVDVKQGDGLAADRVPAEGKVGDVHAILAHRVPQKADDARHVGVGGIEHVFPDLGVDVDALDLDETRFAIAEDGACHGPLAFVGDHGDLDITVEGTGFVLIGGRDLDAPFLGDNRGGDHVHIRIGPFHDARDDSAIQRLEVHFGYGAVIEDVDGLDRLVRHLAGEAAQMARQLDPGAHDLRLFGGDGWHVERVFNGPGQQIVGHLFGNLQRHVFLCLAGGRAQMRGHHDIGQVEERVFRGRFLGKNIEGRACDVARFERFGQRHLVHEATPGTVDDPHAGFHHRDLLGGDHVGGLVGLGHVQGDEIGAFQKVFKLDLFDAHLVGLLFAEEGVERNHLHFQPPGAITDDAANVAGPDHAQRLAGEFGAHEPGLFPLARMCGGRCFGDLAGHGEHHRDGMFGGGDHVAVRRVHHDHTLFGGGLLVDVVGSDACPPDDLEIGRVFQDRGRDAGGRADGKAIILADDLGQPVLVLAQIGFEIDFNAAILEDLHGGLGEFVRDQYFGSHFAGPFEKALFLGLCPRRCAPPPGYFWPRERAGWRRCYALISVSNAQASQGSMA